MITNNAMRERERFLTRKKQVVMRVRARAIRQRKSNNFEKIEIFSVSFQASLRKDINLKLKSNFQRFLDDLPII